MSLRTSAVSDDFPHLPAWFGRTPTFEHLKTQSEYKCTDYWFRMRQVVDCRYYMNWHYADSESYTAGAYFSAIEDLMTCRRIAALPSDARPEATREWFVRRQNSKTQNDVWEYREPPTLVGKYTLDGY